MKVKDGKFKWNIEEAEGWGLCLLIAIQAVGFAVFMYSFMWFSIVLLG